VALDALSKFASLFYAKDINLDISFNLNSNKSTFVIDTTNRLAVKKIKLDNLSQEPTTELSFDVKGYGTALVQVNSLNNLKLVDTFSFIKYEKKNLADNKIQSKR